MEGSDSELVSRATAGDRGAFSALVDRHAGPVWAAVSRATPDRETARDVFQETWVRAFERLHTLRGAGKLRSWLLSIALNQMREHGRRSGRRPGTDESEAEREPEAAAGPEERSQGGELRSRLAGAVARLPPRQREVVELRVTFERSYAEIAETLGIREENARANFYQALKRLRGELADEDVP